MSSEAKPRLYEERGHHRALWGTISRGTWLTGEGTSSESYGVADGELLGGCCYSPADRG